MKLPNTYQMLTIALFISLTIVAFCLYNEHLQNSVVSFPVIFCDTPMSGKVIDSVVLSIDEKEIEQYNRSGW